jgi:hypothetical protein
MTTVGQRSVSETGERRYGPSPRANHTINLKTPRAVLGMQGAAVACLPHQNPITAPLAPDVASVDSQRHAYLIDLLGHAELGILLVTIGAVKARSDGERATYSNDGDTSNSTVVHDATQNDRLAAVRSGQARIPVSTRGLELDGQRGYPISHAYASTGKCI